MGCLYKYNCHIKIVKIWSKQTLKNVSIYHLGRHKTGKNIQQPNYLFKNISKNLQKTILNHTPTLHLFFLPTLPPFQKIKKKTKKTENREEFLTRGMGVTHFRAILQCPVPQKNTIDTADCRVVFFFFFWCWT